MMHTLKSFRDSLLAVLKAQAVYLKVKEEDIGKGKKDGTMPQSAPSIWLYAEPNKPRQNERSRANELKGTLAIFANNVGNVELNTEADDEAIELCERADKIILDNAENFFIRITEESYVQLDGMYGNYSTAYIKYEFQYKSSAQ